MPELLETRLVDPWRRGMDDTSGCRQTSAGVWRLYV